MALTNQAEKARSGDMMADPDDDNGTALIATSRGETHLASIVAVDSGIVDLLAGMPIGFTDGQFETVLLAAAALPRDRRDDFLRAVAGKLPAEPTDGEVQQAIALAIG